MAVYEHLPIFRKLIELTVLVEQTVQRSLKRTLMAGSHTALLRADKGFDDWGRCRSAKHTKVKNGAPRKVNRG